MAKIGKIAKWLSSQNSQHKQNSQSNQKVTNVTKRSRIECLLIERKIRSFKTHGDLRMVVLVNKQIRNHF